MENETVGIFLPVRFIGRKLLGFFRHAAEMERDRKIFDHSTGTRAGKREVIKIENTNATSSAMSNAMLDAKTLQGKRLTVTALIRTEDVAEPAKSYLGVKLMIVVVRNDGSVKYFENLPAHCRFGTYRWKAAKVSAAIPADAERVFLSIGLQQTSGVVFYSGFRCEVQP